MTSLDVREKFIDKNGDKWWKKPWLLAFRDITSPTNERTIIATVLPSNVGAGHNIPLLLPNCEADLAACLLGNLNSLIVDFVDRVKQSGVHASFFIVKQLPILSPQQYTQRDIDFITNRIAKLTRNSEEINKIWLIDKPCYRFQQPKERLRIRAELDAYYAKLYGLTRDELRYILDPEDVMGASFHSVTFPGLKRNETKEFGEYLTGRLVLEAFDALENGTLH